MFGTIKPPNTSTESLSQPQSSQPISKLNLVYAIETQLSNIPNQFISNLCTKIYPVQQQSTNVYSSLYKTLLNYFTLQMAKKNNYDNIVGDVTRMASGINEQLCTKISFLLRRQDIKSRLLENIYKNNPNLSNTFAASNLNSSSLASSTHLSILDTKKSNPVGQSINLLETIGNKYQSETNTNKYVNLLNKQLNDGYRRESPAHTNQEFSAAIAEKYMRQRILVQNVVNKMEISKQLTQMEKITRKCVICQNALIVGDLNEGNINRHTFKCKDCGEYFHKKCMPRDNNCSFCQLKNISPLQKVKTQLFLGILKKGTKKHEIQFQISKAHISGDNQSLGDSSNKKNKNISNLMMPSIEIRCIRLKQYNDSVSNFINLFPDACTIMVNNRLIKQFQPLHKQSSLKYRRDQCIKITSNVAQGLNKITITQRIVKKDVKTEQRIQPENHLVGVYIIDQLQIPKQHTKLEQFLAKSGYLNGNSSNGVENFLANLGCKMSQFSQSEQMLKSSLFIGNKKNGQSLIDDEEIVCDSIKVSLTCSLTLQKMKYPGRTIFCKHFNCFDVYNFILLNAQAKLPKWQCPICKASAYNFKIDCVLNSIVGQLQKIKQNKKITSSQHIKQNQQATQVEIDKNMNIRLLNSQGNILISKQSKVVKDKSQQYLQTEFYPYWISSIYDLSIDGKQKRFKQQTQQENKKNNKMVSQQSLQDQSGKSSKKKDKNASNHKQQAKQTKQKESWKMGQKQMKKIVRSVEQSQSNQCETPFLIIHGNKSERKQSNKKNKAQTTNSNNQEPKSSKKPMEFEIRMQPFAHEFKQQNQKVIDQKQHQMIQQNKLQSPYKNTGKELNKEEKSTIINEEDIKQKQEKSQKRKDLNNLLSEVLQAKQQIKRLNLNDDSSENLKSQKNIENQLFQENIRKEDNNKATSSDKVTHQKLGEEDIQLQQQKKGSCLISQSKSDKMSEEDIDMEQVIRQYEERYKKVLQSSSNIPKVIHASKVDNFLGSKDKSKDQAEDMMKNIIEQPISNKLSQQVQEKCPIFQQKQLEFQPFQSSYKSADYQEKNNQLNYKVELHSQKNNQSNSYLNSNPVYNYDYSNPMIKDNKDLSNENKNPQNHFSLQNDEQLLQMLKQTVKQKAGQQLEENRKAPFNDQYQINLSFLSPHHQTHIVNKPKKTLLANSDRQKQVLNLYQNFKQKQKFQLEGNKQKNLSTNQSKKKHSKSSTPSQKTKCKAKPKPKSKPGQFNIPQDADIIQLSD